MDQNVNLNGTLTRRSEYHNPRKAEIIHMVPKDHNAKAVTMHITLMISPVLEISSIPTVSPWVRGSIDLNPEPIRRMA